MDNTEFMIHNSFKLNLGTTEIDKNDDFSDFCFESIFEAGVPQGPPRSIPRIKK